MKKISRKLGFVVILALVMCMSVVAAANYYYCVDYNGGQDKYGNTQTQLPYESSPALASLLETVQEHAADVNVKKDNATIKSWTILNGDTVISGDLDFMWADNYSDLKFQAIWEAITTGGGVVGDPESFISDAIQTVDIFPADEKLTYVQGSGKDVTFFFPEADIEQFSGYGLNFETTAKYNVDYTVSAGENGVFLTLKASYLDTLEKGNNTPILFFTRNNPNPSGGIGLADLNVK